MFRGAYYISSRINQLTSRLENNNCSAKWLFTCHCRFNHSDKGNDDPFKGPNSSKYRIFRDEDATTILDVEEERRTEIKKEERVYESTDEFKGLNLQSKGIHINFISAPALSTIEQCYRVLDSIAFALSGNSTAQLYSLMKTKLHPELLWKLKSILPPTYFLIIQSYLSERFFQVNQATL